MTRITITKAHLFKYIENFTPKNENFQIKNSDKINKKNNVYPSKPQVFFYIKVGFKGGKTIYACFLGEISIRIYSLFL